MFKKIISLVAKEHWEIEKETGKRRNEFTLKKEEERDCDD